MIEQSDSIKNLGEALLNAQGDLKGIAENATNPFFNKRYADLGSHIQTIKPIFKKYGLVVTQFPTGGDNEIGITTLLIHPESGEYLKSTATIPMEKEAGNSKAQTAGKTISYLRRYALAALANVYSGDDNDGNSEGGSTGSHGRPLDPKKLKTVLAKKVIDYQGKKANDELKSFVAEALSSCVESDPDRYAVTEFLTGKRSILDISDEMIFAFRDWLGLNERDVPTEEAVQEIQKILKEVRKKGSESK